MAFANNMTKLLNKIERRLGTQELNLPEEYSKDKWAEVIIDETLTTFSRFYPHKIQFEVSERTCKKKNGYWLINEDIFPGIEILGIRDILWDSFNAECGIIAGNTYLGMYDYWANPFGLEDVMLLQMKADQMSLFNNGVYVEFEQPNKIRLKSSTNVNLINSLNVFNIELLIKHSDNLNTIEPTKMETFEQLATCDVANFLYNGLKYYEGLDTVYATIDLKLSDLQSIATNRETYIAKLEEGYVSASNMNQPLIYTT